MAKMSLFRLVSRHEDIGLAPLVAPAADHVPAKEMPGFVSDHARELRLVPHAQKQSGENDREAGREHHRVEVGDMREIDAHVLCGRPTDSPDDVLEIGDQLGILDQQVRAGNLFLCPVHQLPETFLVGICRAKARTDQRNHVGGTNTRLGNAGRHRRRKRSASGEKRAAV